MNYKKHKSSKVMAIAIFLVILLSVFTGCAQNMAAKKDELLPEPKLITEISTSEDPESFNILVKGNRELTYMSVKQLFPLSVLLYFPETALGNIKTNISLESEIVDSITAFELTEKGHKSRIKIALKKDVPYKATNKGTDINISFAKPSKTLSSATFSSVEQVKKPVETKEKTEVKKEKAVIESKKQILDKTSEITGKTTTKYTKPALVNRIDFSSKQTGKSTIIIGTTRPVEYRIKKVSRQLLQIKLLDTRLPDYRKFPLITTRFESAVDKIIPVQTPAMKNTSMLTIELRESVPYFIEQNDNLLLIHFDASTISPRPSENAKLPAWKKVMAQTEVKPTSREVQKPVKKTVADSVVTEMNNAAVEYDIDTQKRTDSYTGEKTELDIYRLYKTKKLYTGEKIALDFYETNVKSVLRILKEVSGKNFAIDDDVTGRITLTLDKPVPWDQALDLVLKMNKLGKIYEGEIIRIATLVTLQAEEEQLKEKLKAKQDAVRQEDHITMFFPINYANAKDLNKFHILPNEETKSKGILTIPDEKKDTNQYGQSTVDERLNMIVITDVPLVLKQAKEIIQKLDKVTPQVIIEARIVEATTNFSREIGTQWGAATGEQPTSPMDTAAMGGGWFVDEKYPGVVRDTNAIGFLDNSIGGGKGFTHSTYGTNMAMNVPDSLLASSMGSIGFNFTKLVGTPLLLNAKLLAMESQGDLKIISSPKIVTLDNEKATISQGIKYPYIVTDAQTGIPETKYEDVELLLEVTPHATPDGRISMEIHIKKYDVGTLYEAGRSFDTKETNTKLLVDDGDTIVIGGILKTTKSSGETGVPWLSKIPLLGWLFKSTSKTNNKEELLIFITPRIVKLEQRDMIDD